MRERRILYHLLVFTVVILFSSCNKDNRDNLYEIKADFTVVPSDGATTTLFEFDAGETLKMAQKDVPVFVRWDWNHDGIWDHPFSTKTTFTHRYYAPGTYRAFMEASNVFGLKDTLSVTIHVDQGYSAPKAFFVSHPDSSNILTSFLLDASLTKDDEDSLNSLLFRWDFNGDNQWDTEFDTLPSISHVFSSAAEYQCRLEVRDPSGLSGYYSETLIANLIDDHIKPQFTFECGHCTVEDTVNFDASSSSSSLPYPVSQFSWDFYDDGIWDIKADDKPVASFVFLKNGKHKVRLRAIDARGLYMDLVDTVEIFQANNPPIGRLRISSHVGNTGSTFFLHSKASHDRDESLFDLRFKWDLNGDGKWETQWDDQMEVFTAYPDTGMYRVKLRVIDSGDKYHDVIDSIRIFPGSHETGYILDKRGEYGGDLYGTVKIGNQWWMQENLRYYNSNLEDPIPMRAYQNDPANHEYYGGLYFFRETESTISLCPDGWRVPTQADYQKLFDTLGEDQLTSKIKYGGSSEFHMKLGGWIEFNTIFRGMPVMTHLWTADKDRQNILPLGIFISASPTETRFVYTNYSSAYYIRCIQE